MEPAGRRDLRPRKLPPGPPANTDAPAAAAGMQLQLRRVSYDGKKVLFSWCRHYANLDGDGNKFDKSHLAKDGFYHLFEINANGTGLRA